MTRKIECPYCNKVMHYTKLYEHQRQKECMKVVMSKMIEEGWSPLQNTAMTGGRRDGSKVAKKGLKKQIEKIMKRAES